MPAYHALEAFAGRNLRRLFGPLHRRRRRPIPRHAGVDEEALRRARTAWWADDPRWYRGGTPPRLHNRVTPHIPLKRPNAHQIVQTRLLALLAETALRVPVRILVWSGAPFLFQPTT